MYLAPESKHEAVLPLIFMGAASLPPLAAYHTPDEASRLS